MSRRPQLLSFTALAHPARRRILLTLNFEGGSMTAGKIADVFEHAWPTTTRHIRMLESAGLLCHDQKGRNRASHINRRRVELLRDWLTWFSKARTNPGGAHGHKEKS